VAKRKKGKTADSNKARKNPETEVKAGAGGMTTANKIIIALLSVAILTGGVLIYVLLSKGDAAPPEETPERLTSGGRGVVVGPDNVEQIAEELSTPAPDSYYMTVMNVNWEFDTWDAPSRNAYVENSEDNVRTVYFDLTLDATGQLIYSSPYIPVGQFLTGFALDSEVPAGTHAATVTYTLVDDDYNDITDVAVGVTLLIHN
jgi:hypothetical protein